MTTKLHLALFSGLLFYVVSNPVTYTLVDSLFKFVGVKVAAGGKPTGLGLILHSLVFAAVVYLLMCM
jgi:hypothetical protein